MTRTPLAPLPENPLVSLVVAMRNEATGIEACLGSILAQTYPSARLEVLVFDGESSDRSRELAESLLSGRPGALVGTNPRRIQAAAWNLGIDAARGDVIGIVSGHAVLAPDYVEAAVEVLRRTGADLVGGPVRAVGDGPVAAAIALATSVPFGAGGARFRYLDREQEVDTVFMGIGPGSVYRTFRFDEEMVRDQDDELSYRLLDAGRRIVCSPRIQSTYRSRATIGGLWRQYFDYGSWKVRVFQKHPAQVRLRQLAPTAFVVAIVGGLIAGFLWRPAWILLVAVLAAYGTAMAAAIAGLRGRAGAGILALLPAAFVTLHAGYGFGTLAGLLRHRRWEPGSLALLARQVVRRARG